MCRGTGVILREEWDNTSHPNEKSEKKKKQEADEKVGPSIFGGMQAAREQREKDWYEKGPFKISDFRKAE